MTRSPPPQAPPDDILPDIAQATAQIRSAHQQETSWLQRNLDRLTAFVGWPGFIAILTMAVGVWMATNLLAAHWGIKPLDAPPFAWLQMAASTSAIFVAVLILTTQRRADRLADHRSQLVLELVITTDRKISKIIELIEEQRRDSPTIANRVDGEAAIMSTPSDAHAVLKAIKDAPE
jgi:uncharacterized membrane protein